MSPPVQHPTDLHVSVSLDRTRLLEGEEIQITVTPDFDAYLHIFRVEYPWNWTPLCPNHHVKEPLVQAGRRFTYPSEAVRREGVRLIAQLPAEAGMSVQMIWVIATKTALSCWSQDSEERTGADPTSHAMSRILQDRVCSFRVWKEASLRDGGYAEACQVYVVYRKTGQAV